MDEQHLQRRYALALSLVPDPDAAADLFMAARDDDDLHRRAKAWCAAHRLPAPPPNPVLPELDAVQQEYALHLARRAGRRRHSLPWMAGAAVVLLVLSVAGGLKALRAPMESRMQSETPAATPIRGASRGSDPLTIRRQTGRPVADDDDTCGRVEMTTSRSGGPVLVLYLPYSPAGPEPAVASAVMDVMPSNEWPGRLSLDVRARYAEPGSRTCYRMNVVLDLPAEVKGRDLAFSITIRPEAVGGGMAYWSDPILIP